MDRFKSIVAPSEGVYKEKGSTFLGYAFPIEDEDTFKRKLAEFKAQHPDAVHHCYAFRLKPNGSLYRFSDDGEPANTGGKPIYGQLLSFELTQVAVVVVRYYGGTKLGVGGLITAYKEAAKEALLAAEIIEKDITTTLTVIFGYEQTAQINQIIHHQKLTIIHQDFGSSCSFTLEFPLHKKESLIALFQSIQGITLITSEG
jgi:uncharacterized YigZ family protein